MEDEILRAAKTEAGRLEALLNEHPIYLRLQAVRRIIDLYDEQPRIASGPSQAFSPTKRRGSRAGSQAAAIRDGAAQYLYEKGGRASSGEIYEALTLRGVNVVGKKPSGVVASYLSNSDRFDCTSEGYGLIESVLTSTGAETPNSSSTAARPLKPNGTEPISLPECGFR
jgi:hypothetical protein